MKLVLVLILFFLSKLDVTATEDVSNINSSSKSKSIQVAPRYVSDIKAPTLNLHQFIVDIFESGAAEQPSVVYNTISWTMSNYNDLAAYQVKSISYPRGARLDWSKMSKDLYVDWSSAQYVYKDDEWSIVARYTARGKCPRYKYLTTEQDALLDFSFDIILEHTCLDEGAYASYINESTKITQSISPSVVSFVARPFTSPHQLPREESYVVSYEELMNSNSDRTGPIYIENGRMIINRNATMVFTASGMVATPVQLNASLTIRVNAGVSVTLLGLISGPGSLTKSGAGALLILNAQNTYTGGIDIQMGQVTVGHNAQNTYTGGTDIQMGQVTVGHRFPLDAGPITLTFAGSYTLG